MYLRCSAESNPAWKGKRRALFQNNSNHTPASTSRNICPSRDALDSPTLICQRKAATEPIAPRTIHNGQLFFMASNVRSPLTMELPGPGVFAVAASAAGRHEEPAKDTSQLSSLRRLDWSAAKVSQSAGGPL